MTQIAPLGRYRAFDADGNPLAGGKLYTYIAGTSTPKATYTDNTTTTANSNPVVLDADGYADVWLDVGGYKFTLNDSNDVLQWTKDNISGAGATGFASIVVSRSSGFSLSVNDNNSVNVCTAGLTISLLPAATAGEGYVVMIINRSSGNVTIDPDGAETINGASTLVLSAGSSATIHCNGTTWFSSTANNPADSILETQLAFRMTGVISAFGGTSAPTGWLLCSGQAVSRTTYAALFAVTSTTFGVGDGSTTFNVPDLRGRVMAGVDNMGGSTASRITNAICGITGTTLGASGGNEALHQHTHTVTDPGHGHSLTFYTGGAAFPSSNAYLTDRVGGNVGTNTASGSAGTASSSVASNTTGITNQNAGTGSSQNVQPTMMLNFIIKT